MTKAFIYQVDFSDEDYGFAWTCHWPPSLKINKIQVKANDGIFDTHLQFLIEKSIRMIVLDIILVCSSPNKTTEEIFDIKSKLRMYSIDETNSESSLTMTFNSIHHLNALYSNHLIS